MSAVRQRGSPQSLGAEEHQPEALQREVAADEAIRSTSTEVCADRLEGDAIEKQSDRGDDEQRQRDIDRDRRFWACERIGQARRARPGRGC